MVMMLASSAVYRVFEPQYGISCVRAPVGQTKDYKTGICCVSVKHTESRRKSKDCLARNQDNVSEWGYMYIRGLLFQ